MTPSETRSMRLSDGTRLDASIWRPSGPGPHPVLLMRQPYGRAIASTVTLAHPAWYAAQGFIVVVQDVRGAGSSEGHFIVYANEAEDGAEAVAWAAGLPGSSGRVGMYGFSYQGASQLLAASQAPAALGAITPSMSVWDVYAEKSADGGAFAMAGCGGWAAQMGALEARRRGDVAGHAALTAWTNAPRYDGTTPACPEILARTADQHHYEEWRSRPPGDPYWGRVSPSRRIDPTRFAVPALHSGGWFDYNLSGTWGGYHALAGVAAAPQALVIGPWTHLAWAPRQSGQDFGPAALGDMDALHIAWFDWALKGRGGPPVVGARVFDLGTKAWRDFPAWPRTLPHRLHLAGDGRVAVREGALSGQSAAASTERFVHDPYRPVPSTPPLMDRSEIDQRTDVLAFTGTPLAAPLTILGVVRVELAMAADAPSFDVSAVLSVVRPDGRAMVLTSGYRHVPDGGSVVVEMTPTCITLAPGERLRLSIAGAAFPAYPVNPGTGTDPRAATAMETVPIFYELHTQDSALVLPRLPG
ncbi:CocE/NonD family hydrolase [Humitalea sp. 24SJ18S-53]|uniref:CocE/NonD family hydrolase n=1 Tax=Humitalea sp. 24SJ18S-53 TaxID=3422307 RepID=UPI003D673C2E